MWTDKEEWLIRETASRLEQTPAGTPITVRAKHYRIPMFMFSLCYLKPIIWWQFENDPLCNSASIAWRINFSVTFYLLFQISDLFQSDVFC